jgi:hypothetical protein
MDFGFSEFFAIMKNIAVKLPTCCFADTFLLCKLQGVEFLGPRLGTQV